MTNQSTSNTILNWLSAERKWSDWQKWTATKGKGISSRTLRRALEAKKLTPRQNKAIEMAKLYIQLQTEAKQAEIKETITQAAAKDGMRLVL